MFFKKRIIFKAEKDFLSSKKKDENEYNFFLVTLSNLQELYALKDREKLGQRAESRLLHGNVFAVIATKETVAVGFYWGVKGSKNNVVWHDKIPLFEKQGLAFNAYVFPDFRRKGIYRLLQYEVHKHLFENGCQEVFTIVEEANAPSIKANVKFGLEICAKNYLLKILGKNIISIIKKPKEVNYYYVASGAQSHNF